MKDMLDLSPLKRLAIIEVAKRLGIPVRGTKAMCFMGHDRATPSLSFLKSRNTWRCFGACGKHGDTISLVMEKEKIDFKSAIEWFAQNFGVDVRRQSHHRRPLQVKPKPTVTAAQAMPQHDMEFAMDAELYAWLIENCPAVSSPKGIAYINSHGISQASANRFNLRELYNPASVFLRLVNRWGDQRVYRSGVAWGKEGHPASLIWGSHAILFPFYEHGSVTYIQARMLQSDRKYLNPRGIAKPLFNTNRLSTLPAGSLVHICEGVPDTIAMETHGFAAVGVLGATSFRPEWVDQCLKFNTEALCHGDSAGEKFAATISNLFLNRGKSVRCILLPKGQDAADVLAGGGNTTSPGQITWPDYGQTGCSNHQAIA